MARRSDRGPNARCGACGSEPHCVLAAAAMRAVRTPELDAFCTRDGGVAILVRLRCRAAVKDRDLHTLGRQLSVIGHRLRAKRSQQLQSGLAEPNVVDRLRWLAVGAQQVGEQTLVEHVREECGEGWPRRLALPADRPAVGVPQVRLGAATARCILDAPKQQVLGFQLGQGVHSPMRTS